ncbi:hypothetical protein ACHAXR_007008 [Thalassiosira sp. AJA248-18]
MASQTKPLVHHVDGPMLPHLNHFSPRATTTSLVPILTPPIPSSSSSSSDTSHNLGSDDGENQQYLLVPNPQRIVVRSSIHGKRVCDLILPDGEGNNNVDIRAVTVAWLPRHHVEKDQSEEEQEDDEDDDDDDDDSSDNDNDDDGEWIVLAGCNNGIVHEWSIADLSDASSRSEVGRGPRRSFQLTSSAMKKMDLVHLTSASTEEDASKLLSSNGDAVLYGLIKGIDNDSNEEPSWLVRCEIPPFVLPKEGENQNNFTLPVKPLVSVKTVPSKVFDEEMSENNHVCLKKEDCIFGLGASYRLSSKPDDGDRMDYMMDNDNENMFANGDIFVVMCSSHGLAIYRDSLQTQQVDDVVVDASHSLVHLTKSMKSSQYYSKDQSAFSSMAISPGTKDLALGRANGHIEVLDDLFENVANYLDQLGKNSSEEKSLQHPGEVTVRRTLHWHAHPVRALAFLTAYGRHHKGSMNDGSFANPMSLLSGGEESVLVTWQLDRNFHKPSNFVARVGQGGIVHTLCCQHSGKIMVFCSDNSIQCYNGSNYERDWAEQGLASMALHGVDEKQQDGPNKSPIILVKDPITNYPMLTNLPGAPGMVHWYDPKSASVVGTLEVAPYNRVSRRDPLTDPHIPAPIVTHMAVGQDGKDMVTVDTVWTENTSVGSAYDLTGPQGTTPMNVCTSIKFWTYLDSSKGGKSDQRKRRNGDAPMSYELVSAMAAPHGREGEVCALAVAPNGSVACTLSQEEDAFRVWAKSAVTSPAGVASTHWKCLYKVKTPSGYANLLSQRATPALSQQLVTFSSDGTVLSVAYGPYITLWDHSNATLLTSMTLDVNATVSRASKDIQSVNFLTKNDDAMLLTTASQIGVKSPFGGAKSCYLGNDEWSFDVGSFDKEGIVSASVPLYDFECKSAAGGVFAVAITVGNGSKSVISVISRDEGKVVCAEGADSPLQWQVDGEVQSLCLDKCVGSFVRLLAVTKDCQMISLSCGSDGHARNGLAAPRLEVQSTRDAQAQAPVLKTGAKAADEEPPVKRRKVTIGISGENFSGFEFPSLSGKFTSSFIAQSLGRGSN